MVLTRISHRYCREIAQMGMATRKATEETGDVLLVRWRYPTEPDAVDMSISAIAVNICEKYGLRLAWPRICCTIVKGTPARTISMARVWRRTCGWARVLENPHSRVSFLNIPKKFERSTEKALPFISGNRARYRASFFTAGSGTGTIFLMFFLWGL